MRKNAVQAVVVHTGSNPHSRTLADKVSSFHAEIIERRLRHADLTAEQKIDVIDKLLASLHSREVDGIIS